MATVKLIFQKHKSLKDGSYPVALRLSHQRNPTVYFRVNGLSVINPNEWNKELSRFTKMKTDYKEFNKILADIEIKADSILSKLLSQNSFSYHKFRNQYLGKVVNDLIFESFEKKISELTDLAKFGTADAYTSSMNALSDFTKRRHLVFSDIDFRFLTSFEHHLRVKGNVGNTISYKIRPLRALHYAYCNAANNPLPSAYRRFKVGRLTEGTTKRALDKNELKRFIDYLPMSEGQRIAKDIFMFSLLTRGMNIADIAFLKTDNLIGNKIIYKRVKTSTIFTISITEEIKTIIDNYKEEEYLFPIIKTNHKNTKYSIRLFTKYVNKHLQMIADDINIPKITSYYARYSYCAMARDVGISIELISQALGHGNLRTTEVYMNSFSNDKLDKITEKILLNL